MTPSMWFLVCTIASAVFVLSHIWWQVKKGDDGFDEMQRRELNARLEDDWLVRAAVQANDLNFLPYFPCMDYRVRWCSSRMLEPDAMRFTVQLLAHLPLSVGGSQYIKEDDHA